MLFQQLAPGPVVVLQHFGGRLDRVALHVLDRFVQFVIGKIDTRGTGKVRHPGFGTGVAQILITLGQCLGLGGRHDHVQAHKQLDVVRVAARRHGAGTHLVDLGFGRGLGLPADKHALGMATGKHQAAIRTAGLKQYRGALR